MSIERALQGFDAYRQLIERLHDKRMEVLAALRTADGTELYRAQGEMRALDHVFDVLTEEPIEPASTDHEHDHYA